MIGFESIKTECPLIPLNSDAEILRYSDARYAWVHKKPGFHNLNQWSAEERTYFLSIGYLISEAMRVRSIRAMVSRGIMTSEELNEYLEANPYLKKRVSELID